MIIIMTIGIIATGTGFHIIGMGIVREAQTKVEMDLNAAREVYQQKLHEVAEVVRFTTLRRFAVREAMKKNDYELLLSALLESRQASTLDILTVTDTQGRVIVRSRNPRLEQARRALICASHFQNRQRPTQKC